MAERKPKPTAVKKLEGNPGKRKQNTKEPVPGKGIPYCPKWLLTFPSHLPDHTPDKAHTYRSNNLPS